MASWDPSPLQAESPNDRATTVVASKPVTLRDVQKAMGPLLFDSRPESGTHQRFTFESKPGEYRPGSGDPARVIRLWRAFVEERRLRLMSICSYYN
jgi:hypothetical protein